MLFLESHQMKQTTHRLWMCVANFCNAALKGRGPDLGPTITPAPVPRINMIHKLDAINQNPQDIFSLLLQTSGPDFYEMVHIGKQFRLHRQAPWVFAKLEPEYHSYVLSRS